MFFLKNRQYCAEQERQKIIAVEYFHRRCLQIVDEPEMLLEIPRNQPMRISTAVIRGVRSELVAPSASWY